MHRNPLGHISLGVRNYEIAKQFYNAVLPTIGLHLVYDSVPVSPSDGPRTVGYGPDADHEVVNIFEYESEASAPGRGSHIAFNATSREAVDQFHNAAIKNGGKNNGLPGVRPHYGSNYYAAFVIDPEGWRLEVVCKEKVEQGQNDG